MPIKKGTLRGSEAGSVPFMCYEAMKKANKLMKSAQIHATFDPALKITRLSVGTALHELAVKGIVHKTGNRKCMLYNLTGKVLPVRVPVQKYWSDKKPTLPIASTPKEPERKPNANTINVYRYETSSPVPSPVSEKHHRVEAAVRINCNSCEWYGPEKGCKECRYELPHRKVAA